MTPKIFAIQTEPGSCRIKLLTDRSGGWNYICDYIIFGCIDSTWYAVFVEMKKTFNEGNHGKEQLRRSLPVLNYIRQTCELELEEDITRPKVGYVLLFNQINVRLDKQSMKPANTGLIDEINWK